MKRNILLMSVLTICAIIAGCSSSNEPVPADNANGFKGYIYYSNGDNVYRMQLSNQTTTELFSNARYPEVTTKGEILCVEIRPNTRIIYTDIAGASRKSLLEGVDYNGPVYKQYMINPRISYNQKYVVYEGGSLSSTNSYVIDAESGDLLTIIGDYSAKNPMISPSWAPDGSIFVQGWEKMNNGIYKISADFSTYVRIDPNLSNVSQPSVSPDGKKIAFIRDQKLWTMGVDGSNPTLLNTTTTNLYRPVWSPDSKYIAVISSGHIHIIDPNSLTDTEITKHHYVNINDQLSWSN